MEAPESAIWVLSMWLMKKSRKVVPVMTSMKDDVFATSLIKRYGARPVSLQNMCLATFAVTYDVIQSTRKKKLMVVMMKKEKCRTPKRITL